MRKGRYVRMKQLNICIALLTAAALLLTGCAGNREKGGETTGTAEAGQQEDRPHYVYGYERAGDHSGEAGRPDRGADRL